MGCLILCCDSIKLNYWLTPAQCWCPAWSWRSCPSGIGSETCLTCRDSWAGSKGSALESLSFCCCYCWYSDPETHRCYCCCHYQMKRSCGCSLCCYWGWGGSWDCWVWVCWPCQWVGSGRRMNAASCLSQIWTLRLAIFGRREGGEKGAMWGVWLSGRRGLIL